MDQSEWWTASDGRALEEAIEMAKRASGCYPWGSRRPMCTDRLRVLRLGETSIEALARAIDQSTWPD